MVWRSSFLLFPEKELELTLLTLKLTVKAVKLNTATVKVWKRRRANLLKFEENIIYKDASLWATDRQLVTAHIR